MYVYRCLLFGQPIFKPFQRTADLAPRSCPLVIAISFLAHPQLFAIFRAPVFFCAGSGPVTCCSFSSQPFTHQSTYHDHGSSHRNGPANAFFDGTRFRASGRARGSLWRTVVEGQQRLTGGVPNNAPPQRSALCSHRPRGPRIKWLRKMQARGERVGVPQGEEPSLLVVVEKHSSCACVNFGGATREQVSGTCWTSVLVGTLPECTAPYPLLRTPDSTPRGGCGRQLCRSVLDRLSWPQARRKSTRRRCTCSLCC